MHRVVLRQVANGMGIWKYTGLRGRKENERHSWRRRREPIEMIQLSCQQLFVMIYGLEATVRM